MTGHHLPPLLLQHQELAARLLQVLEVPQPSDFAPNRLAVPCPAVSAKPSVHSSQPDLEVPATEVRDRLFGRRPSKVMKELGWYHLLEHLETHHQSHSAPSRAVMIATCYFEDPPQPPKFPQRPSTCLLSSSTGANAPALAILHLFGTPWCWTVTPPLLLLVAGNSIR
jgi:hypothetical protein